MGYFGKMWNRADEPTGEWDDYMRFVKSGDRWYLSEIDFDVWHRARY